jgi:hypothetical protein
MFIYLSMNSLTVLTGWLFIPMITELPWSYQNLIFSGSLITEGTPTSLSNSTTSWKRISAMICDPYNYRDCGTFFLTLIALIYADLLTLLNAFIYWYLPFLHRPKLAHACPANTSFLNLQHLRNIEIFSHMSQR